MASYWQATVWLAAWQVMNATDLGGYLKGSKRLFDHDELKPVMRQFDQQCRFVEF